MSVPEIFLRDAISGAIGGEAYPVQAPDTARPPYAIYRRGSTDRERTMVDAAKIANAQFQVFAVAETYFAAKDMANTIRIGTDNFTGSHSGCEILTTFVTDEADGEPVEYEGDTKPAYTIGMTIEIRYREA